MSSNNSSIQVTDLKAEFVNGTLHVSANVQTQQHGNKVSIVEMHPQGINPHILLLKVVVTPPSGMAIQTPEVHKVEFEKALQGNHKYTEVAIVDPPCSAKVE